MPRSQASSKSLLAGGPGLPHGNVGTRQVWLAGGGRDSRSRGSAACARISWGQTARSSAGRGRAAAPLPVQGVGRFGTPSGDGSGHAAEVWVGAPGAGKARGGGEAGRGSRLA